MRDSSSWTSDQLQNPAVPPLPPPSVTLCCPPPKKSTMVSTQFECQGEFTSPLFEIRSSGKTKKAIKSELA